MAIDYLSPLLPLLSVSPSVSLDLLDHLPFCGAKADEPSTQSSVLGTETDSAVRFNCCKEACLPSSLSQFVV